MRYIIYGAGAVGGVIGARLHQAGHNVILIARGAHLEAIRAQGLVFETPIETVIVPVATVARPSEITFTPDDVVLLTMKTQHTEAALSDLLDVAGADVPVICAQNGVENERIALRRLPRVYGMMVWLPATMLEPGIVQASAAPVNGVLDTGCYPTGVDSFIKRVAGDIDAAGIASKPVPDIMRWKYAKLLANLGNAIQAACAPDADARSLYARVRAEAVACFQAAGIVTASDAEQSERRTAMSRPAAIGGRVRSGGSTWQSIARGVGSVETDYLNGEISLLGRMHDIPTPANDALCTIMRSMLREGSRPGSIRIVDIEAQIERPNNRERL
jgi:2-dehydropantoate 2-reductase